MVDDEKEGVNSGYFPIAMLVKALIDGAFDGTKWTFTESTAYEFDLKDAEEYDKLFPLKEKKILPCQEEFYIYSHSFIHD